MSVDKSRIPKLSDRSWKFIPKKKRNTINDPFVERTQEARKKKGKKTSGATVKTRSQKVSQDKRMTLEVEIHRSPSHDEDPVESGTEGEGTSRLAKKKFESARERQDFSTLTGTPD